MSMSRTQSGGAERRRMRVVAVTGISGKTTTAWLTASVLAEAGLRVGVVSDLGCVAADGALADPIDPARPEARVAWLERLAAAGCSHAVLEVPPEAFGPGAFGRHACDTVVVTGASRMPRRTGPTARAMARRIVSSLAPGGCLIAPRGRGFAELAAAAARSGRCTCLTAGLDGACDVSARPVARGLHGQTFLASAAGQMVPVTVDVPIASFARNALCAAAVGLVHGVPLHVAARGIESAGCVAGRMERLDRGQDFAAFLDAPRSRHALSSTLASLRRLTGGRLAVVAEQRLVEVLGAAAFAEPLRRRCDDVVMVPSGVLDDDPDEVALAAYARVDRLLGRLGEGDSLLVLGTPGRPGCGDAGVPLATLVDGWLRLACPPQRVGAAARRAA